MKKETNENEIISMTKYLFARYRLAMYGYLNRMLGNGTLAKMIGFEFCDSVINKDSCSFPSVQYWRINRTSLYADVSVCLDLDTNAGAISWSGTLTILIDAADEGSLYFSIEALTSRCPDREHSIMLSPFLVPYLKNKGMEQEASQIWKRYLPDIEPVCTDQYAYQLAENMGLNVMHLPLKNKNIDSVLFFIDDTIDTRDCSLPNAPIETVNIPANTIVINSNTIKKDYSAFSVLHECVHYYEHFLFFRLQEAKNNDATKLHFEQDDDAKPCGDPIYWMERQANRIAYAVMLPGADFAWRAEKALSNVGYYINDGELYQKAIDSIASNLYLPDFRIRARMIQLGHIAAKGACNYVDRHRIQPFAFDKESLPDEQLTFVIDQNTAYDLYKESADFKNLIDTGDYVYVDGHIVRNIETYVQTSDFGSDLTRRALDHIDDCSLRFTRVYEPRQPEKYKHGRLFFDSDYVKQTSFYVNDTVNRQQMDELSAKQDYIKEFPRDFKEAINMLIARNEMSQNTLAEQLGMDPRTLSRHIAEPEKNITPDFIMLVSLIMRLPDWISNLLFKRAHIQLDEEEPRHLAFRYIQRVLWIDGVQSANDFLKNLKLEPLTI